MTVLGTDKGSTFVATGAGLKVVSGGNMVFDVAIIDAEARGSLVETDLRLPADARVERVSFTVTAEPGGSTELSSVAQIRPAPAVNKQAAACTVDFGRLVTVAGLGYEGFPVLAPSIAAVYRWTGAAWSPPMPGTGFPEVAAERLLVETTDANITGRQLIQALQANGAVELPAGPGPLELLVDGNTVWFERQGSTPGSSPPTAPGGVGYVVDRTDAVRGAFERAAVVDGRRTVRVALRAAAPGKLVLQPTVRSLRTHLVQFPPEGVARTVELPEEGVRRFDLAPPASATEVREVDLVVRGSFGPDRVQPAEGPAIEPDARLALAPGRPMLVGLPAVLARRFGKLVGVRLRFTARVGGSGGEVGGRLLADDGGRPGAPLPGGELATLTVAAGSDGWSTLGLVEAVELPPPPERRGRTAPVSPVAAWLELQLAYGEVECALTAAGADDAETPGAPLRRRLPGGGMVPLTTIPALGELRAAVRLVGRPGRDRPVPAVTLGVARSADLVGVAPTGDDLTAVLTLSDPVRPADGPVELVATVAAPGSLTVDTVHVAFSEGAVP